MKKNPFWIFGTAPSILTRRGADNVARLLNGESLDDLPPSTPSSPKNLDRILRDVAEHGIKIRASLEAEIAGSR